MLKWWMHLTMGTALGFILAVSFATVAARSGEVWLSCYATSTRSPGSPERWIMTFKCGKGDIANVVAELQ
ncbi:hypothetical protein LCGC14_0471950 [marine sediment metagenome]|uniref:Uncharacterized protein n=1 Tax=marine sediment metagenome TaxID=412755 RepID=A0A0F9SH55_9ZZZZ